MTENIMYVREKRKNLECEEESGCVEGEGERGRRSLFLWGEMVRRKERKKERERERKRERKKERASERKEER